MENIVTVVILIVGGALLAIIVSAICGKRKLQRHKEFSRKDPHVPGSETHKVGTINWQHCRCGSSR
jgi:hypothetical protein